MSTKLAITAVLVAALSGPALAGDQDLATLLRDSGRYVPEAGLSGSPARGVPSGAEASARGVGVPAHAYASAVRPAVGAPFAAANDFQLQGR